MTSTDKNCSNQYINLLVSLFISVFFIRLVTPESLIRTCSTWFSTKPEPIVYHIDVFYTFSFVLLSFLTVLLMYRCRFVSYIPLKKLVVFIVIFVVYCLTSSLCSPTKYKIWMLLGDICCFASTILWMNEHNLDKLMRLLVLVGFLEVVSGIFYYMCNIHQFVTPNFGHRTGGTFEDPNAFYPFCLFMVPITLYFAEVSSKYWEALFYYFVSFSSCVALVLTFSRAGWLALSVIGLLFPYLFRKSRIGWGRRTVTIIMLASVILLSSSLFVRTNGRILGNHNDRSFWGRTAIWKVSYSIILQHPWLGVGMGNYENAQDQYMTSDLKQFNPYNKESKSLILNLLAELGGVGLFLLVCIISALLKLLKSTIGMKYRNLGNYSTTVLILLLCTNISGIFDTPAFQADRAAATLLLLIAIASYIVKIDLNYNASKDLDRQTI